MDIPNEKIMEAYGKAPQPIREFLVSGELNALAQRLAKEHQLHIDTTGTLVDILTKTLLGFTSPKELPAALARDIGLPQEAANQFIETLNRELFMPLQKKVREEGAGPSKEERLAEEKASDAPAPKRLATLPVNIRPETPVMQVGPPPVPPVPSPAPLPPPQPVSSTAAPIAPVSIQPSQPPVAPAQPTPTPIYRNAIDATDYLPNAHTMPGDMQMASQGMHGTPVTPARSFQTASVPVTYASPPASPTLPPPQPVSQPAPISYAQPVTAPVRLTPVDKAYAGAPITKEYGSDPYREPIE